MSTSCCICSEFTTGLLSPDMRRAYGVPKRPTITIGSFFLCPSASPLSSPHILIFPERHVSRLSDLAIDSISDLQELVSRKILGEKGIFQSSTMVFEHGVGRDHGVACGIDHAHLHIIAIDELSGSRVHDRVLRDYPPDARGTLEELLGFHSGEGSYLLYGSNAVRLNICRSASIPSQYMRRIVADELGLESWDWRTLSGQDAFKATADSLSEFPMQVGIG